MDKKNDLIIKAEDIKVKLKDGSVKSIEEWQEEISKGIGKAFVSKRELNDISVGILCGAVLGTVIALIMIYMI